MITVGRLGSQLLRWDAMLIVYLIAALFLIFLTTIGYEIIAIIVCPIFPLILMVYLSSSWLFIIDFRVIYLGSLFIWSLGKSISLYWGFADVHIRGSFLVLYILSMAGSSLITFMFPINDLRKYFYSYEFKFKAKLDWTLVFLFWVLLTGALSWSMEQPGDSTHGFLSKQLSQGFVMVFASIIIMMGNIWKHGVSIMASGCVFCVTVYTFLGGPLNRTSLLLPVSVMFLAFVVDNPILRRIAKKGKLWALIMIGSLLAMTAFIYGDLQKQTGINGTTLYLYAINNPDEVMSVMIKTNYLPSKYSGEDYFNSLNAIVESGSYMPGGVIIQLLSSVTPRIFFPSKGDTDVSYVKWTEGFLPQMQYYEIFLEPFIDSGIVGVLAYYTLFLFLVSLSWRAILILKDEFKGYYCRSVYILNLVCLFLVIRGPVIFLIWYAVIPNVVVWWWLVRGNVYSRS
jgi:hypothetical protein